MTFVLLTLLAGLAQDTPAREQASGFTFIRTKGWGRHEIPQQNTVALVPPGIPAGQECSLLVFPGGDNDELFALVFHDRMLQSVTQGARLEGTVEKGYRGGFQFSHTRMVNAQGQRGWIALYTIKSGTRLEALLFVASSEELFKAHRRGAERMIVSIEFPGAQPASFPTGYEWKPAPIPEGKKDVPILGVWLTAKMEMAFSADPVAGGVKPRFVKRLLVLFANQVAAQVDATNSGLLDTTYVSEGLATLDVSEPAALADNRRFGHWSEADGKITIKWNYGAPLTCVREQENLRGNDDMQWSALKPIDGIRLEGTFTRPNDVTLPWSITLGKDGTFEADQVNEVMGGKLVNPKCPELGAGSYELRKWSLILRFDNGFVQSFHFNYDGSDDPRTATKILLNGYVFDREGTPPPAAPAVPAPATPAGGAPAVAPPAAAPPATRTTTPGASAIHGLLIPVPAGWARQDDPGGAVMLVPPADQNSPGDMVLVLPPNVFVGTHWETHKALLKEVMKQAQWAEVISTRHLADGPGHFVRTATGGKDAAGQVREIQLFTAAHDGVMESVLALNRVSLNDVLAMLKGTTFKEPPRQVFRPRIVEAYRRMDQKLYINTTGGAMVPGSLMYERIWLRSDGAADFTGWYTEGYAASPLALKLDKGLENGDCGSWKEVGGKVHIVRHSGSPAEVYTRENGSLRLSGQEWKPMPRVDGLRLAGRWSSRSAPAETVSPFHDWIEFTAEGRFRTEEALYHVSSLDPEYPRPPRSGSGTYEIRDWTVFFTFDDGKSWSTDFSTIGEDTRDPSSILLRTYAFAKEK